MPGTEIVDETDRVVNMRRFAERMRPAGLDQEEPGVDAASDDTGTQSPPAED